MQCCSVESLTLTHTSRFTIIDFIPQLLLHPPPTEPLMMNWAFQWQQYVHSHVAILYTPMDSAHWLTLISLHLRLTLQSASLPEPILSPNLPSPRSIDDILSHKLCFGFCDAGINHTIQMTPIFSIQSKRGCRYWSFWKDDRIITHFRKLELCVYYLLLSRTSHIWYQGGVKCHSNWSLFSPEGCTESQSIQTADRSQVLKNVPT